MCFLCVSAILCLSVFVQNPAATSDDIHLVGNCSDTGKLIVLSVATMNPYTVNNETSYSLYIYEWGVCLCFTPDTIFPPDKVIVLHVITLLSEQTALQF